jgi:hypothetical protein
MEVRSQSLPRLLCIVIIKINQLNIVKKDENSSGLLKVNSANNNFQS